MEGGISHLNTWAETLGKALTQSRSPAQVLLSCRASPATQSTPLMEIAYWRTSYDEYINIYIYIYIYYILYTQIYRVGACAWADGPVWGLHLRDHLWGTYGKFWKFPQPRGPGSNRPGRGAERSPSIQTERVRLMNF